MADYKLILGKCEEQIPGIKEKISGVISSPPYNTSRSDMQNRYDEFDDDFTQEEYINWTKDIFNKVEKILEPNGVIVWNISYGIETIEKAQTPWLVVADIIRDTDFTVAEHLVWKKSTTMPLGGSPNHLTRIVEDVFVFCRKSEFQTFNCNKGLKKVSRTGQQYFESIENFIEAPNNDGGEHCKVHKATYSTEFAEKLLGIYFKEQDTVLDPFNGTGTTGVACLKNDVNYIGIELSKQYYDISEKRLQKIKKAKDSSLDEW